MEEEKENPIMEENMAENTELEETVQAGEQKEKIEEEQIADVEELDITPISKAEEWLKQNEGNLKYLDSKKIDRLKKMLAQSATPDAKMLEELSSLQAELEKEAEKKFNQEFNEVKSGLVKLREEMFQIPGYDNLPDELQEVALNTFTNCEIRLANTRLIDELREIFDNFKNTVYPDLAGKIYALENPNVLPVNLIEVLDSMPRLTFNNEEELDGALAQLREAAVKKLKKARPKK